MRSADGLLCVDFGSTFTKAALVDAAGRLVGTASHRTTVHTDVMDGYDACVAELRETHPEVVRAEVLACSSAGGGLRIGIVGNEELVTAEAGRRVALSSGGKVVCVVPLATAVDPTADLVAAAPDVVLLVGGTDGGNAEVLLSGAELLAGQPWPVVVAGNARAQDVVSGVFSATGTAYVLADNVVPRIGVLAPDSARAAIREMFLRHVIGGKGLSARSGFAAMVRGATPDVVLTGVEVVAATLGQDVVVVDVGGATTDVHSVVVLDPEDAALGREVVATTPVTRTVEGDLGMRWSAESAVRAGLAEGLLNDARDLLEAAGVRTADPSYLPRDQHDTGVDEQIARVAVILAVRRHAGRSKVGIGADGRVVERTGKDLRDADLLVGSGGALRYASQEAVGRILGAVTGHDPDGWQQPESPRVVVDGDYVLAAIGLLAAQRPHLAAVLARQAFSALPPPGAGRGVPANI